MYSIRCFSTEIHVKQDNVLITIIRMMYGWVDENAVTRGSQERNPVFPREQRFSIC